MSALGDGLAFAWAMFKLLLPEPRPKRPPVKPAPVPARTPAEEARNRDAN